MISSACFLLALIFASLALPATLAIAQDERDMAQPFTSVDITSTPQDAGSSISDAIFDQIVNTFSTKTSDWGAKLESYAVSLFQICLTLSVVMFGVKAALNRTDLHEILSQFVMMLLFVLFIFSVINNYQAWSWNIINGLQDIGSKIQPNTVAAAGPIKIGLNIINGILKGVSATSPINSLGQILCGIVILVSLALMTAQIIFVKCEAMIAMNAAVILLGLGGCEYFKQYAINVMRYVLAVAFKLFVLNLVVGLGITFMTELNLAGANLADLFVAIGVSIILLALTKSIPDVCSGIINGSHVSSGAALGQAVTSVAAGAAGVAAGAWATGAAGRAAGGAAYSAGKMADMAGKGGFGKMAHMAGSLWSAHKDAQAAAGQKSHLGRVRDFSSQKLQEMKMQGMGSGNSGGSGSDGGSGGQA